MQKPPKTKPKTREEQAQAKKRLAEALKRNLQRRKAVKR